MLFLIFAGIAIVVIGAASLMWPTISPRVSNTTVKPPTDTASAPQDSTTVKSATDTASAPESSAEDFLKSLTRSPSSSSSSLLSPDGHFISPFKDSVGREVTQWERDWKARGEALAAQANRIQSRIDSRLNTIPPDWEKINEDTRELSKIQEEWSKLLNEADEKAKEAIERIKAN
jgi:hypothetical protein